MNILKRIGYCETRLDKLERLLNSEKDWKITVEGSESPIYVETVVRDILTNHTTDYHVGEVIYETSDNKYLISAFYKDERRITVQCCSNTPMLDILGQFAIGALKNKQGEPLVQTTKTDYLRLIELAKKYE